MQPLPCAECHGFCCGPVPVTEEELRRLRKAISAMSSKRRSSLREQHRCRGTCIFYDLATNRCGVYPAWPAVCRAFGYHRNLRCFRRPELAADEKNWVAESDHAGLLSTHFTWEYFHRSPH